MRILRFQPDPCFFLAKVGIAGEGTVTVPAGRFVCWHVTLRAGELAEDYWIDQVSGQLVRSREPFHQPGMVLEQVLEAVR